MSLAPKTRLKNIQNKVWPNTYASCNSVKLTHKINYHQVGPNTLCHNVVPFAVILQPKVTGGERDFLFFLTYLFILDFIFCADILPIYMSKCWEVFICKSREVLRVQWALAILSHMCAHWPAEASPAKSLEARCLFVVFSMLRSPTLVLLCGSCVMLWLLLWFSTSAALLTSGTS